MKQNKLSRIFYLFTFILVWFSFFLNNDSHSQSLEIGRPLSKIFINKDYNSSRINWCVIQDNRGIVYIGNENGILEFDGNTWRKIEVPNSEAVRATDVADDGTIYLCAGFDFGYLEPNSKGLFEFKSLLQLLDEKYHNFGEMWDVATSSHGIYFKNSDKVFRWSGNDFMVWDSVYAFRLYNINDTIYSRNQDTGLIMVDGDSIKLMPDGEYLADTGVYNMLPFKKEGEDSKILITTDRAGLFINDGKKFSTFKTEIDDFLTENRVYNASIMSDGKIAIATRRGGVVIINKDGKLQNKMNKSSGLPTDVIYDVWLDQRGGLWMASNNGVIYSEISSSFSILDKYILQEDQLYSIMRFEGKLYLANTIGIFNFSEKTNSFELLKESKCEATSFLEANGVLLAITNDGIATIKDDEIIDKYYADVYTLYKSKYFKDRIYAGSNYGFFILEKGYDDKFKETYSKDLFNLVTNFAEDSNGSLWIDGLFRGIYHVTGKLDELTSGLDSNVNYEYLTLKDGLPELKNGLFNIQDKVFLSTSKGMFLYSDSLNSFVRDSSLGSIFSDSTYSLSILGSSGNNNLWMLRDSASNKDFRKAKLNPNGKYTWELLPEFRRLDAKSINSVYHDFDKLSNEEILWIVSEESLFRYKENKSKNLQSDFNTFIRKVIVNNDSLIYGGAPLRSNLKDKYELEYNQNNIGFEFSSASFEKPEANSYSYILKGNDNEWSDWSEETKKNYTNLSSGDYSFHLIAKNVYGKIGNHAIINFRVLSPLYYSWWAFSIYSLIFAMGIFIVDRIQRKRLLKKAQERMKMQDAMHRVQTAELQAKAAEAQSMLIQAENERQTKELEEARQLQLSMLPKELPQLPNLDIAVYMKTAAEVGGDYYDFNVGLDGILTAVIGDASGHGMMSGMMVSIMKSFFISNRSNLELKQFFENCNNSIKDMQLGRLMLASMGVQITSEKIIATNAGMPSLLYFRNKSQKTGEFVSNNLPLGAMKGVKYSLKEIKYEKGDTLLLMSDGFEN